MIAFFRQSVARLLKRRAVNNAAAVTPLPPVIAVETVDLSKYIPDRPRRPLGPNQVNFLRRNAKFEEMLAITDRVWEETHAAWQQHGLLTRPVPGQVSSVTKISLANQERDSISSRLFVPPNTAAAE